jgi:hypothetical protein
METRSVAKYSASYTNFRNLIRAKKYIQYSGVKRVNIVISQFSNSSRS